jgi:hypothetical protein
MKYGYDGVFRLLTKGDAGIGKTVVDSSLQLGANMPAACDDAWLTARGFSRALRLRPWLFTLPVNTDAAQQQPTALLSTCSTFVSMCHE